MADSIALGGGPLGVAERAGVVVEPHDVAAIDIHQQGAARGQEHDAHGELTRAQRERGAMNGAHPAARIDREGDDLRRIRGR